MKKSVEPESFADCVALVLRKSRLRIGLQQRDAAKQLGVTQATLSRWESCQNHMHLAQLFQVCAVYKIVPHHVVRAAERRWNRHEGKAKDENNGK